MDYYEYAGVLENGLKYKIRVNYYSDRGFYIDDIAVILKGKRLETFVMRKLSDNYSYRRLNIPERRKAELKLFVSVVGEDVLNKALMAAWESKRPTEISPEDYLIEY